MISIHEQYKKQLIEAGFSGEISGDKKDTSAHMTDESIFAIEPQLVIYPKSTQDVVRAVSAITDLQSKENPIHLTPRAAGTGLSGGSLNDSVVMNTTKHLNTIHSVKKTESGARMTIDPGVMHLDLEKHMDKLGVYIPSYPASKDICTVGGMVGNNSAGPDTLRYGHTASFVRELEVVLHDAQIYTIKPLTWREFEPELSRNDALGEIYRHVWELLLHNEESVLNARPKTAKNSAGYALWDVVSTTVEEFMKDRGVFDLTQAFTGSQGTLGVVTRIVIDALDKNTSDSLLAIPIFDLDQAGLVIDELLQHKPHSVELFDQATYNAALRNPGFFKQRLSGLKYYRVMTSLYANYIFRFKAKAPEFIILANIEQSKNISIADIVKDLETKHNTHAIEVTNAIQSEMFWQIRRASYLLSKTQSANMRPAAFLEDMAVPPKNLPGFFKEIQELFVKHNIQAFIHGHGGNGHLHFYPLLDFTDPNTAKRIPVMAEDFFQTATKHGGNICGEHNDGIIRTPYLNLMFDKTGIAMFEDFENVCDPHDIFNPGKKVNPRFTVAKNIRHTN